MRSVAAPLESPSSPCCPYSRPALHVRDRRALWIVLAGVLGFYLAPLVIVGPPEYPNSGYRSALLAVAVSSIVGLVTHGLVADIRRRAREARHRERVLVRINETVQELFESPNPQTRCLWCGEGNQRRGRGRTVRARRGIPEALRLSALTADTRRAKTPAAAGSAVYDAFRSRQPILISEDVESHLANVELWRANGAPASLLYQPLLKGDAPVGVLVVGWSDIAKQDEPRVIAVSLLAHEIASVIDRADVIGQLTDEALTDALTGLPNRRAWDAEIADALQGSGPVAVAMLDIDHFKRFNDTNGHPAGDRLLREAASRWRSEMRAGDFLARLGGEEFALLVTGADVTTIQTIVARLCARLPAQQTCSAGIALRSAGDASEQLVARADAALYEAKTAGRNRVIFTDARPPAARRGVGLGVQLGQERSEVVGLKPLRRLPQRVLADLHVGVVLTDHLRAVISGLAAPLIITSSTGCSGWGSILDARQRGDRRGRHGSLLRGDPAVLDRHVGDIAGGVDPFQPAGGAVLIGGDETPLGAGRDAGGGRRIELRQRDHLIEVQRTSQRIDLDRVRFPDLAVGRGDDDMTPVSASRGPDLGRVPLRPSAASGASSGVISTTLDRVPELRGPGLVVISASS